MPASRERIATSRRHTRTTMRAREELVGGARAGDRDAFAELVAQEAQGAYRVAFGILGTATEAEDATQDALIRAWRDLPTLRDTSRWGAWFRRLVVHAALDRGRRNRRRPEIGLDSVEAPASRDTIDHVADDVTILAAVARLPVDDRAIVVLRFHADLPLPEVAHALGIPLGTAKSRLHRALARLRRELGDDA